MKAGRAELKALGYSGACSQMLRKQPQGSPENQSFALGRVRDVRVGKEGSLDCEGEEGEWSPRKNDKKRRWLSTS